MSLLSLPLSLCATLTALTAFDPPVLPFTELNDKKIETAIGHMVDARECTPTDMNVVMQLDHIHWKYTQMRQVMYKAAQEAADGSTVNAKDLGKLFDKIDASLEADRERDLERIREEIKRKEAAAKPKGKEI